MYLLRSLLFIPGNRPNMLEKGSNVPADALIPDLEDSVPPGEKVNARQVTAQFLPILSQKVPHLFVRINGVGTGLAWDDLKAVVSRHILGISIGKMVTADMARELDVMITTLEKERGLETGSIKVIPWIETAEGIANALEIARAPRMLGIAFGAEDYTADMGVPRIKDSYQIETAQAMLAIAARAAGILALDTPEPDFKDNNRLVEESNRARALGYKGKFCIHPNQVASVNDVFRPSKEEVEHARKVVEAFEAAGKQGSAAISVEGKMVDTPVWKRCKELLEQNAFIEQRERTANTL